MTSNHIFKITEILRNIRIQDKPIPRTISELPELEKYQSFIEFVHLINLGNLQLNIPNFKLFGVHDFVVPQSEKNSMAIFLFLPYLLAISLSVYGIVIDNYWFLISIPLVVLAPLLSSFLNGVFPNLILLGLSGYFLYTDNTVLGLLCIVVLFSTICTKWMKIRRRKVLINLAKSNEEIFTFLFHNRTISFRDPDTGNLIYSRD